MSDQPFDLHDLFEYLDGAMDADRQAELRTWLDADPSHYALLARASFLHRAIGDALRNEHEGGAAVLEEAAKSPDDSDAVPLLAELARLEVSAKVAPIDLDDRRARAEQAAHDLREASKPEHDVAARDVVAAIGYLGLKALWSRAGLMTVSAIAAVLALVLTLSIVLQAGPTPPERTTQTPEGQTKTQPVATLTNTHNAVWDTQPAGDLRRGSQLHAGQTLTLTAGFAEITTNDGAIAILEAPATIELLDNDNALRLHTGKLVGMCETESSKGFLIQTHTTNIIDLGTRFGVAVDLAGTTTTEVFDGRVLVKSNAPFPRGFVERVLSPSDRLALDAAGLPKPTASSELFTQLTLYNAGVVLNEGAVRWSANRFTSTNYRNWPQSDEVMLIEELRGHRLNRALPIALTEPNTYQQFFQADSTQLSAGTVIRTYIVMFNPAQSGKALRTGSVTFEGEVIGIVADETLNDAYLAAIGEDGRLVRGASNAWMESKRSIDSFDQITLHPDRKTLSYVFNVQGTCDMFRVIVREPIKSTNSNFAN